MRFEDLKLTWHTTDYGVYVVTDGKQPQRERCFGLFYRDAATMPVITGIINSSWRKICIKLTLNELWAYCRSRYSLYGSSMTAQDDYNVLLKYSAEHIQFQHEQEGQWHVVNGGTIRQRQALPAEFI